MYDLRELYPNIGVITTHELTIPEGAEQKAYYEKESKSTPPIDVQKPGNLWISLGLMVGVLFLLTVV